MRDDASGERSEGHYCRPAAVVGIGASAGGLGALKDFFAAVPQRSGISFVVVQHLAPDHDSLLPEILSRHSPLRVVPATHGVRLAANTVYVAPAGANLRIESGVLKLSSPAQPRGLRSPIDIFLRSLARDQRQDAVAVILSGTGNDGTQGVREIKECGGMVMVQHPSDASHDGMPLSAIETGQADYVLPSSALPEALVRYVDHNSLFDDGSIDPSEFHQQLEEIRHLIRFHADHDFEHYKQTTLLRRVQRRMGLVGVGDIDEYVHLLKDRPSEIKALAQDLLICVTSFFRTPEAWETLQREVLEKLVRDRPAEQPLRIWIPGCATGEEAYTMAILLIEALQGRRDLRVQIFATDISNHALRVARAAVYPEVISSDVKPERLRKHFIREGNCYRVNKALREMVVFAAHDLKGDPPFFRLDLISCRNLLIYLEPQAQQQILRKFHFALNPDGYLMLGSSESAGRFEEGFAPVDSRAKIYRRIGESTAEDLVAASAHAKLSRPVRSQRVVRLQAPSLREVAADMFWKETAAAVLLLNDQLQPVYVGGAVNRFLQIPEGEQRYTVYELIRPGIQLKLRRAIQRLQAETEARFERATVRQPDGSTLSVRGVARRVSLEPHYNHLVYLRLEEEPLPLPLPERDAEFTGDSQEQLVQMLERELLATREELSTTIEQLEQANEELKASNEEAMSVNEELQSGTEELEASREELQSLNEELTTLNAQLEDKLHELEAANNDLQNLISSTRITVVFLDTAFRVRNFTPEATDLFHLIRTDIGRPISDLAHKFTDDDFLEDAREVLKTLTPMQREVTGEDDRVFVRRLLPYRTQDNRIEGVVATFHEVTELKQAQYELAIQQEQLRLVTDSLPVLIAYIDREQRYRFANARYEEWFGVAAHQIIGRTLREMLGDTAYELVRENVERAVAGETVAWEAELPYRYGPKRYVHVEYIPHRSPKGEVLGFYGLIQDITKRHQAEEAVRQSEVEFRSIFELAGSGKAQADPATGRFLRVNRRFCAITGFSADELLQKCYSDITHPEDLDRDREEFEAVLRGEQQHWTTEKRFLRKDGEIAWVLVTGTVVRNLDQSPRFTIATIQDITDRKRAEEALREGESRFRALADNITQLAWMADSLGRGTWYNRRWYEFTGMTYDQLQGEGWMKLHHPDHQPRVAAKLKEYAEREEPWEDTFPLRRHDGEYCWFLSRAVPIRDEQGSVVRWFGTNTDITDQMELEQSLKEADRRKDEFLAMLAHELRNPLAPIRSGIDLLLMQPGDHHGAVEVMDEQVGHLVRLVDDLLDVSRITRGKVELRCEPVRLQDVVQKTVDQIRPNIDACEHQLLVVLPDQPVWLNADPVRLVQVFENLLSNAVKYTDCGGEITVEAERQSDSVAVRVRDSGLGIDADLQPRIFDLFTQASRSADREQGGLGIGLTIVKNLVELHGGSVSVQSAGPGQGSEFRVALPVAAAPAGNPDPPREEGTSQRRKVLVVDDNRSARHMLSKLLRRLGDHTVETAADGEDALKKFVSFNPQVVLLDIGLPRIDGYEVAKRIREMECGKSARLVALTGYGQCEDRQRSEAAGFDLHLVKPVGVDQLRDLLRYARRD